ncbi:hypothetical protein [Tenuifilum thalassicum]|uniref:DUF4340 domain-containing protein n=1 Tax=Tenuifilum thalassicum TaxID=2590900 RepID=A0A7D3XVU3_9BACT|nr:hypothetical protein [Tenuifilum thalassicum]QKG80171.1 hypothetical protein FHG85_07830 [Tenuifilum thalassicum]
MSKNRVLSFILFVVLVVSAYIFYLWFTGKDDSFKVEVNKVSRVELIKGTDSLFLEKNESYWLLNKRHLADEKAVQYFFDVLGSLNVISPATLKVDKKIEEVIPLSSVKLNAYKGGWLLQSFYVASIPEFNYKPVALKVGGYKPYYIESAYAQDDLMDYFAVNPNYWVSNRLFIEPIDAIETINVTFPDVSKSYKIRFTDKDILITNYKGQEVDSFDLARVSRIYNSWENLKLRVPADSLLKSIKPDNLLETITLDFAGGKTYTFHLYKITGDAYKNLLGEALSYDPNHILISTSDNRILLGTYYHFHFILSHIDDLIVNNRN